MKPEDRYKCARRSCGQVCTKSEWVEDADPKDSRFKYYHCPKCGHDSFYLVKALFIPLKTEFFEAFKGGSKTEEFRVYGSNWNERSCFIGREVILAKGYGKKHRLKGVISGFRVSDEPTKTEAWKKCYGTNQQVLAACIKIELRKD